MSIPRHHPSTQPTFNIIPIHTPLADHPSLRYPEIRAAASSLLAVQDLPRPPFSAPWHDRMDLLDWLSSFFCFQPDNVRNQREHLVLHLANSHLRLSPPPSSSSTFLRLQNPTNPTTATLFLVSSPLRGGSSVLLRFYTLLKTTSQFGKTHVICNQTGLNFDENKSGVVFDVSHGVSIKLVGSVNVFVMYSVSNAKAWVFAVKMMDDDGVSVKLMKCAVIDCIVPVFAVSVSYGYLMLGEENGVRVFALRPLVKGRVFKRRRGEIRELSNGKLEGQSLPNGVHHTIRTIEGEGTMEICSNNGYLEWKSDKHCDSVKLKSVKLGQDSKGGSTCFAAFKNKEVDSYKLSKVPLQPAKAISIQALSPKKFLILDSVGQLHLMCLSLPVVPVGGSDIHCHVKQLTNTMKVEKLAVLPDVATRTQTVWISDGCHTLHMLAVSEMDTSVGEKENKDSEEKPVGISVIQAIFASEKIEDVIPLATNAVLLLGQGNLYAYTIS